MENGGHHVYVYIYIQRRDIFRLPSTDASVARAVRPTVVLAPDIVAGEFVVEADDAVVAGTERERERKQNRTIRKRFRCSIYILPRVSSAATRGHEGWMGPRNQCDNRSMSRWS